MGYLDNFEMIGHIGSGGFGQVWQIRDKLDGKEYALKKIVYGSDRTDESLKEAQALANLEHQNIVRYYDCNIGEVGDDDLISLFGPQDAITARAYDTGEEEDAESDSVAGPGGIKLTHILFIKMELCKESLKTWIENIHPKTGLNLILNVFFQIAVAVKFTHMKGFIHRDLKPENIFMTIRGQETHTIKIGDFGLVTLATPNTNNKHTTRLGTPPYAAPELMNGVPGTGKSAYDAKIDVYSMGVIFLELLFPIKTRTELTKICESLRNGKFPVGFSVEHSEEKGKIIEMMEPRPEFRPISKKIHIWLKNYRRSPNSCTCHSIN